MPQCLFTTMRSCAVVLALLQQTAIGLQPMQRWRFHRFHEALLTVKCKAFDHAAPEVAIGRNNSALEVALCELRSAVKEAQFAPGRCSGFSARRVEVRVSSNDTELPLQWLRTQYSVQRCYFSPPMISSNTAVAGIGVCDVVQGEGPSIGNAVFRRAKKLPTGAAFVGGARFAPGRVPDDEWKGFRGYSFLLPLVSVEYDCNELVVACHLAGRGATLALSRLAVLSTLDAITAHERQLQPSLLHEFHPGISYKVAPVNTQRVAWETTVAAALSQIKTSILDKVVVARRQEIVFSRSPAELDVLNALQIDRGNKILCYRFALQIDESGAVFFGCSPEALLEVSSDDRLVTIDSIAGTCGRGKNKDTDDILAIELLESRKDALENTLVASFVAQRLQHLALRGVIRFGTTIDDINLVKLPSVMHLKRTLSAHLSPIASPLLASRSLIRSLHPTPAVLGLPRQPATKFLEMHEEFDRGFYAGPFGIVRFQDTSFTVAIRSALFLTTNNTLFAYAGAGLVRGSHAQAEWQEIDNKLKPISSALKLLE